MSEIVPYIVLILVLLALELIQIVCAKSKIKKWILQILAFLFSLLVMGISIAIEINHTAPGSEKSKWYDVSMGTLMMFSVLNIPTLMFIATNVIVKKKTVIRL